MENKTFEELKAIEDEVVDLCDKTDVEVSEHKITLPTENLEDVSNYICAFLNKQVATINNIDFMVAMFDFWEQEKKDTIPFPVLDTTLRTLSQLQFVGIEEWRAMRKINKYFEPIKDEYIEIGSKVYLASQKHCAVMDAIKLHQPLDTPYEEVATEGKDTQGSAE